MLTSPGDGFVTIIEFTSGNTVVLVGAATFGPASGTVTITFADGSTQQSTVSFDNWQQSTSVNNVHRRR